MSRLVPSLDFNEDLRYLVLFLVSSLLWEVFIKDLVRVSMASFNMYAVGSCVLPCIELILKWMGTS